MTNFHSAIVLTHVAAMLGLISALAIEGIALKSLRRAVSYEQAREWTGVWALLPAVGAPSLLLSLASGIYLATMLGVWNFGWAQIAVPTLVIVAIAGGVAGPRRNRVRAAIGSNLGPLPAGLRQQIRDPLLSASWRVRAALMSGLVADMVLKPDGAVAFIAVTALLGVGWSVPQWRRN
jgi:hypothetical protein